MLKLFQIEMEFKYNTCACASKVQKFQGYNQIENLIGSLGPK